MIHAQANSLNTDPHGFPQTSCGTSKYEFFTDSNSIMFFSVYLLIGMFAGSLSGLLGIGGGIVVVPALLFWFQHIHLFPKEIAMHLATGTSLATMIGTSCASATTYHQHGFVVWPIFWRFFPGLCFGMALGSMIANHISSQMLTHAFAFFLLFVALHLILSRNARDSKQSIVNQATNTFPNAQQRATRYWPNKRLVLYLLIFISIFIGALSTLFGIGGGILIVPFFLFLGLSMNEASGTSALTGIPISLLGTMILTISGWHYTKLQSTPWGTIGYIYWPAAIMISLSSIFLAKKSSDYAIKAHPMVRKAFLSILLIVCSFNIFFYHE